MSPDHCNLRTDRVHCAIQATGEIAEMAHQQRQRWMWRQGLIPQDPKQLLPLALRHTQESPLAIAIDPDPIGQVEEQAQLLPHNVHSLQVSGM
jgi:hypothetical protein